MSYDTLILAEPSLLEYWPLNDAAASPSAANLKDGAQPLAIAAAGVTFGVAGLLTDGETAVNGTGGSFENVAFGWPAGSDWTIESWFQTTNGGTILLWCFRDAAGNWAGLSGGAFTFQGSHTSSVGGLNDGNPHHVALTYVAASGTLTMFIDSVQVGTWSGVSGLSPVFNGLTVGAQNGGSFPWSGKYEKFAVYTSSLSPSTVASHYTAGVSIPSTVYAIGDVGATYSPGNWYHGPGFKQTINSGAEAVFGVSNTSFVKIGIDIAALTALAPLADAYPEVWYLVDGVMNVVQLTAGQTEINIASGLTLAAHRIQIGLKMSDAYTARWGGVNCLKILSVTVSAGGVIVDAPNPPPTGSMLVFSDSTGEGGHTLAAPFALNYAQGGDSRVVFWQAVARGLACRLGLIAFGGQSWGHGFWNADIPGFADSWQWILNGVPRLVYGKFPFPVDVICIEFGANGVDPATIGDTLSGIRAASGIRTVIAVFAPTNGAYAATLQTEVAAYKAESGDLNTYFIPQTPLDLWHTWDGIHQKVTGQVILAGEKTAALIQIAFANGFTSVDRNNLLAVMSKTALIEAASASFPPNSGSAFDPVGAETSVYWEYTFTKDVALDGWTRISFTIKQSAEDDSDNDALLVLSISNPSAGGADGIKVHNRRPVAAGDTLRTAGAIVAATISPTATLVVTLLPTALQLPPSPDTSPYAFEIDYWLGDGIKRQFGRGDFNLARSVRRGVIAP